MKPLQTIIPLFICFIVVSSCLGAPMTEDDEYDDDPELIDRKQMQKLQAELYEVVQESQNNSKEPIRIPTSTTERPQRKPFNAYKQKKKWMHAKEVRGYQILSDGPPVVAEMIKVRPMLRFKIDIPDTVRDVEKATVGRQLELKIRNWNKVHKVHIKVPFGYQPEDLKVTELRNHIEIIAPIYSDVDESEK